MTGNTNHSSICVITRDLGYMKFGPVWTDPFVDRSITGALDRSAGLFFISPVAKKYRKEGRSRSVHDRFFSYSNHNFGCRHKLREMFTK